MYFSLRALGSCQLDRRTLWLSRQDKMMRVQGNNTDKCFHGSLFSYCHLDVLCSCISQKRFFNYTWMAVGLPTGLRAWIYPTMLLVAEKNKNIVLLLDGRESKHCDIQSFIDGWSNKAWNVLENNPRITYLKLQRRYEWQHTGIQFSSVKRKIDRLFLHQQ